MINDIRPPRRTTTPPPAPRLSTPESQPDRAMIASPAPRERMASGSTNDMAQSASSAPVVNRRPRRGRLPWIVLALLAVVLVVAIGSLLWYNYQLSPLKSGSTARTRVVIASGMSPRQIGNELQSQGLIRDGSIFEMYARLNGVHTKLQAGRYSLSAAESVPQIIDHLKAGKTDTIKIMFYPGATLKSDPKTPENKRSDVMTMLLRAGYPEAEITAALAKSYSHPLFAHKPTGTTLEGYVFGETYTIDVTASVEDILKMTFDEYWNYIQSNKLVEAFQAHGLNLYQGLTLASIVQREVSNPQDQGQVAQVFYSRLASNTVLGSDVTFIYAAQQMGVTPRVNLDSPYNTRQVKGLPPGPIAVPGVGALQAVAHPASGSYMYFVAGEDGKTYFAYTETEHDKNIRDHCGSLCH